MYIAAMDSHVVQDGKNDQLKAALDTISLPWWWFWPIMIFSIYIVLLWCFMSIPEVRQRYMKSGKGLDNNKSMAGSRSEELQIAGLKEQIGALEQRVTDLTTVSDRVDKQFQDYKAEVAANGRDASPAKVDAAIVEVADSDTNIGSMLVKLHRGLNEFEALRKHNPEEIKTLQDFGKR
jgi:hypothetical protein